MKAENNISMRKVSDLSILAENPRTISRKDFQRLVDSIKINGFWQHRPLALEERDGKLVVLAGNQRLKAAKKLKLAEVPTILYSDLTDDDRAELILRDNVNNGEWDTKKLQVEDIFGDVDMDFIGLGDLLKDDQEEEEEKSKGKTAKDGKKSDKDEKVVYTNPDSDDEEDSEDDNEKEAFYRSLYPALLMFILFHFPFFWNGV